MEKTNLLPKLKHSYLTDLPGQIKIFMAEDDHAY